MKAIHKTAMAILALTLCASFVMSSATAAVVPYQSEIFISHSVYLPATMKAEFQATTRKRVASVSISATLQVRENGTWTNCDTNVSPSFSGSNKTGWNTTADYSSDCEKGSTYRLSVVFAVGDVSVTHISNSRTY